MVMKFCRDANGSADNSFQFPPWGVLSSSYFNVVHSKIESPADWKESAPGYAEWLAAHIDALSYLLWPNYDPGKGWSGDAYFRMLSLTRVDFDLMANLFANLAAPIRAAGNLVTHLELYKSEDDPLASLGSNFVAYDQSVDEAFQGDVTRWFLKAILRKLDNTSLILRTKQALMRPRPYQVAALLRFWDFPNQLAVSGMTPAMISGHCLQSVIGGCEAFLEFHKTDETNSCRFDALAQLTVDIGDRRVFAGVHYPSDSLSSWYTAFALIPNVFEAGQTKAVAEFLWLALKQRSSVFAAISQHVRCSKDSPYAKAFHQMESIVASLR